jgi:hypothetical protein
VDCKERSKVAIGGIRFDWQCLINEDPKGLLLMKAHVQKKARCLYQYAMRIRMVPSDTASTNKFNALAWLVWLALSSVLRKDWLCASALPIFRFVSSDERKGRKGFAKSQSIGLQAFVSSAMGGNTYPKTPRVASTYWLSE